MLTDASVVSVCEAIISPLHRAVSVSGIIKSVHVDTDSFICNMIISNAENVCVVLLAVSTAQCAYSSCRPM